MALIETKANGTKVFGTAYSGQYVTYSHKPNCWRVWAKEDHSEIWEMWHETAKEQGLDMYHVWDKMDSELARAAVAEFRTRREARAYIESIGGTWK